MRLDGHHRLDVFVPDALWERMEAARGELSRSEWVRLHIEQGCLRSETGMVATKITISPEVMGLKNIVENSKKSGNAIHGVKTAREILQERTKHMRGEE